jgi:hypothetical protein
LPKPPFFALVSFAMLIKFHYESFSVFANGANGLLLVAR